MSSLLRYAPPLYDFNNKTCLTISSHYLQVLNYRFPCVALPLLTVFRQVLSPSDAFFALHYVVALYPMNTQTWSLTALHLFYSFFFCFFFAVSFHSRHSFKAYALQASCALTVEGILTQMQLNNWFVPIGSNLSYVQYFCVCTSKEYVNIIFRVVLPHAGCFVFLSHISSFLMSPFAFNVSCRHGF